MQVLNDRIDEFIDLWGRAFGERITRDQARTRAHQLIELYGAISEDLALKNREAPPPIAEEPDTASPPGGGSELPPPRR